MKKGPHRCFSVWQGGGGVFRNAGSGKCSACGTGGSIKAWAQAVDYDDRHQFRYFAPLLPAMETPQIIRAHDPHELDSAGNGPATKISYRKCISS